MSLGLRRIGAANWQLTVYLLVDVEAVGSLSLFQIPMEVSRLPSREVDTFEATTLTKLGPGVSELPSAYAHQPVTEASS